MPQTIKEGILKELTRGDRNAGELKDALRIRRYSQLWEAIASLQKEGDVESYFAATPPSATLTYRLIKQESPNAALRFWK
ncbi:MAG: hypothetical protein V7L26_05125 [Nostoc sp.]|uniref:hypothetical protein n=1 Tax=Nostoc sp. TaxID=1180 RepID=UPI002FF1497F